MNENDKILINAYLDGESSTEDSKYIEALLDSNKEANGYANAIKRANTEINTFFNSKDIKEIETNISLFTKNLMLGDSKSNFLKSLGKFFTPQSFVGYVFSASVVYFLMLPVNDSTIKAGFFPNDFTNFNNEINSYYFEKYRGAEDLGNSIKVNLMKSINSMIESKTRSSIMNYGDESYFIKFEDLSVDKESIFCLNGYILNNGISTKFLFCKSLTDETITYIN